MTHHLSHLETSGLIQLARVRPELEYLFRHALVQEAGYDSLLSTDRQRLHRAVGRAIEQLYADRLDEYAAMLARHFDHAGDHQRAIEYYRRAGDAALTSFANREAEGHFRRAVHLCDSESECADLLARFGKALIRQDRLEEGLAVLRESLDLHRSLGDLQAVAHLYARLARATSDSAGFAESLTVCLEGLELVAGAPDSDAVARLLHEAARAYHFSGESIASEPLCRQAIEMAERVDAVDVQADALATLGILPQLPGEEAIAALSKAVELSEAAGLVAIAGRAHNNLGVMILYVHEDPRGSLPHFLRSAQLYERRGASISMISPLLSVVGQSLAIGDVEQSEQALELMAELVASLPDPQPDHRVVQFAHGFVATFKGDFDRALPFYRVAHSASLAHGDRVTLYNVCYNVGITYLAMDRLQPIPSWEEAEDALHLAIDVADGGIISGVSPRCLLSAAYARQDRLDDARRLVSDAERLAASGSTPVSDLAIRTAHLELAIAEGRWADALDAVEKNAAFHLKRERVGYWAAELETWADIHLRRGAPGDRERAHVLLLQARDVYRELGLPLREGPVNEQLAALRTDAFARARAGDAAAVELAMAGRIQAGLLPEALPTLPGWDLAVALEPARDTWGDFYDWIELPDGKMALVIADVVDKGAGAALYMALTRTLLRSLAALHPDDPAQVLTTVNARIVAETHTGMFVTVFYAVLDPQTGEIAYANGGHNPGYLFQPDRSRILSPTGMALGVVPDTTWEARTISPSPGDTLLLYTDGTLDARSPDGDSFGLQRLLACAQANLGRPCAEIQAAILDEIHGHVGNVSQYDDVTLMVVRRT